MRCRLCGKSLFEIKGYLARVNERGVPGIFECRPNCDAQLTEEEIIVAAITGETDGNVHDETQTRG